MQDMLQKSRELTKKTENVSSSDDDEEDVEMIQEKSVKVRSDDDNEDESETKKTSLRTSQLEILKAINKKAGGWLDGPKSKFVYVDEQSNNTSKAVQSSDINGGASDKQQVVSPLREEGVLENKVSHQKSPPFESTSQDSEEEDKSDSALGSQKKRKIDILESEVGGHETAASEPKKKRQKGNKKASLAGADDKDQDGEATKPKEKPVVEVTLETPAEAKDGEDEAEDSDRDNGDDSLKVTMEELFQDEDVVEEFAREKAAAEAKARPKIEDTRLPGWGSWAGPDYKGEKPLTKKQKR